MSFLPKYGRAALILGAFVSFPIQAQVLTSGQSYILASPSDPTPDGLDTIEFPDSFAVSDTGAVYMGYLEKAGVVAVFSTTRSGKTEVVQVGDTIPGGYTLSGLTGELSTNALSQALLYGGVTDSHNATHTALLAGNSYSNLRTVAVSGQNRPDGGQFSDFNPGILNDSGDVAFDGFTGGFLCNVYVGYHDGTLSEIAYVGQTAPGETNTFSQVDTGTIKDSGQVLIDASINDPAHSAGSTDGVYSATSTSDLVKIARSYEAAPGTPYLFGMLGASDMNNSGTAVIYSQLIDGAGVAHGYGIFTGASSTTLQAIAYEGQSAPASLGHYTDFDGSYRINDSGQVAYIGYLDGTVGSGVFVGNGPTQNIIALAGQTAPGGGTFTGFGLVRVNNTGTVVFGAELNGSPTLNGLFLSDGIDTIKVAQEGDTIAGATISQIGIDPNAFNDLSQVVYQAILPNNDMEIVLFAPRLSWRTSGDGTWDEATNWTASLVPADNNDIDIEPDSGGDITGPAANTTVNSLTIGSSGSGVTLLLGGAGLTGGTLTISSGATIATGGVISVQAGGTLTVNSGVSVASGGALGLQTGGTITINDGATIGSGGQLSLQTGSTLTVTSGLTVSAGGLFTGTGVVSVGGGLTNQGTLTPGSTTTVIPGIKTSTEKKMVKALATPAVATPTNAPGTISVTGNYIQAASGNLNIQIAGTTPGNYSQLAVSGSVTLAGTLQLSLLGNVIPKMSVNDSYTLVNAGGTLSDTFSNAANGARIGTTDGSGSFQVNYTSNSVVLSKFVALNATLSVAGTDALITFPSINGRAYTLESSTDLKTWIPVQTGIIGDGTNMVITIGNGVQSPRIFYRIATTTD